MELHCLPTETPTTASSCSTDPLYDNCPPFAQRGRAREREMESRVVCPAVIRLPGPRSPQPGLAPAVAEVPLLVEGGRGTGAWPDHSYCSWRGGLGRAGWEAEMGPEVNRARGGGTQGGNWGVQPNHSPNPSQSEEHRSALSVYDNLPEAVTPDSIQDAFEVEMSLTEKMQEQVYREWTPEQIQGLLEDDKSTWSSCEIILADTGPGSLDRNLDQDKEHEQEPELDSGSCGSKQEDPVSPQHFSACSHQLSQAESRVLWPSAEAQHPEPPSWFPRVPPPVPPADPSASALRSLLTSLQQQIVRQREDYEERITG